MAIKIPHRFIERILPNSDTEFIDLVIIGTFNPGLPDLSILNDIEKSEYLKIKSSEKFMKFNQVLNFYDRPQNRFWKIMDYLNHPDFYKNNDFLLRNKNGLKFYKGMNRDQVFIRQLDFCKKNKILITDIVREIHPDSFQNIYNNFPDTRIEQADCTFNTKGLIKAIKTFNPDRIIINFNPKNNAIPKISGEINKIIKEYNGDCFIATSTSGAAGFEYEYLIEVWKEYFKKKPAAKRGL